MATQTLTFDGGVDGADLSAGSNGIESLPDALVPKFTSAGKHNIGVRTGGSANTTDSRFRVLLGPSGDHYGSIYMKLNTVNASNFVIFMSWANSANSIMASLRCGSDRALNIRVGASTIVRTGSAGEIPLASWFRFDWQVTGTTINWRLHYNPEAAVGDTPDLSGNFTFTSATINKLILGANASQTIAKDWSYDTVRAQNDSASWWDAYSPPDPGDDQEVYVWNGSAETQAEVTVWNGTSEVAAEVTVWNGTSEVPV